MRFVLFYHSLVSDWNHGNAHFLRGIVRELLDRGHEVEVLEPEDGWSRQNLLQQHGPQAEAIYHEAYPRLRSRFYNLQTIDLDRILDEADVVLVHEWSEPELVRRIGRHRARHNGYRLLFHDTHHRIVTAPRDMEKYDLQHYDGVLAFGEVIREEYLNRGWTRQAWTWHEAADARVFRPLAQSEQMGDLVWIGNWGDEERTQELHEYLLEPVKELKLSARIHGVRYPEAGLQALRDAGIESGGWLPNVRAPQTFSQYRVTVHVPRRPYREQLPGIPTIRVFEALACGIPLISAPWEDSEQLFRPGQDFLFARNGREMTDLLSMVLHDSQLARELVAHGLETLLTRHTCWHRVNELLAILHELKTPAASARAVPYP